MSFPGSLGVQSWQPGTIVHEGKFNGTVGRLTAEEKQRYVEDSELSPRSRAPSRSPKPDSKQRSDIAPWDTGPAPQFEGTGAALTGVRSVEDFPEPQWGSMSGNSNGASSPPRSPSFPTLVHPGTASDGVWSGEDQRSPGGGIPSDGSDGRMTSKSLNKVKSFFGDDTDQAPPTLPPASKGENKRPGAMRQLSWTGSKKGTPNSPDSSRPRTPPPPQSSSDVTPWEFDEYTDSRSPVRDDAAELDNEKTDPRRHSTFPFYRDSTTSSHGHHKFSLHRHKKSSENPSTDEIASQQRNQTFALGRRETQPASGSLRHLSTFSNSSSRDSRAGAAMDRRDESASTAETRGPKRSLIDKITGRKKESKSTSESLKSGAGSNVSLPLQGKPATTSDPQSPASTKLSTGEASNGGMARTSNPRQSVSQGTAKREHHSRLPFKSKRGASTDQTLPTSDPPKSSDTQQASGMFHLDTDLSHMDDVISGQAKVATPAAGTTKLGAAADEGAARDPGEDAGAGAWDAPDSWGISKVVGDNDNNQKLQALDEAGELGRQSDSSMSYGIRIFRADGTFMTMNMKLSVSSAEVIQMFCKKSLLQDDLNQYHILLRTQQTSRQLAASERPILLQRRILEQAGYQENDHIETLGREDHSYLCRFTFMHNKTAGYASHEKDPGFSKNQKLSNVDLAGHNLITMPIQLYYKASEIVTLNLSRNVAIDVPKDFIQQCTSLKEIKFSSNEAWRLPPSFALATKLIVLDLSNNRFEDLTSSLLEKLANLSSLNLASNRLRDLPPSFASFKSLRKLVISSNSLSQLPESVLGMEALTELDISFNQIANISDIGRLRHLTRLYANNNKLSGALHDSTATLMKLEDLDIRFNEIDNIDVCANMDQLDTLAAGHNLITKFDGSLPKIRYLTLDHNPITHFTLRTASPLISTLDLASAKLAYLPDELFQMITNLVSLKVSKNHLVSISSQIGRLHKLEKLYLAKNSLSSLPPEIGRLFLLRTLDVRENNLTTIPSEVWFCRSLDTLNASCNVIESFPKIPTSLPAALTDHSSSPHSAPSVTVAMSNGPELDLESEERDKLSDIGGERRGSQMSFGQLSDSSTGSTPRKNSMASFHLAKRGTLSRSSTETTLNPLQRKESVAINRSTSTFMCTMKYLYLADNRLDDDVFEQVNLLQELRLLNLSYNRLDDIDSESMTNLKHLEELHLSRNSLASLPSDDFSDLQALRALFINGNRLNVLPPELHDLSNLMVLDASSNYLKYNVCNVPYDWNWNMNPLLKYLSLSGNKRLEIRPPHGYNAARDPKSLADFSGLTDLRILGLMDVTILVDSIPDNTEDRRIRTTGSMIGSQPYGIADTLGQSDHLSTLDIIVPRYEGHETETLFGLFDAMPSATGGSKVAKYLQDNFRTVLKQEMEASNKKREPLTDALRRTYLALNKNLATVAAQPADVKSRLPDSKKPLAEDKVTLDDLREGCVATILYLHGTELLVSNVGDVQAVIIQSQGAHRFITEKHDPANIAERHRIREAGGYVSKHGKLNDQLAVSRGFGVTHLMPSINAAPYVNQITIDDTDEIILLASRELWDNVTADVIVDVARKERGDLMLASQKLRDLAIAFGATGKVVVMMLGVSEIRKRERARYRSHSLSLGPSGLSDEYMSTPKAQKNRRPKAGRGETAMDSKLARLDQEVDAPQGEVTLIFTDIKSSTQLWELFPTAMRAAIKMHNDVLRRQLRLIGGYEVKTEGDAFMVAFPTVTSALLWAFTVQMQLMEVPWPQEILHSKIGQEERDADDNVLYKGLSVRMGIHWGQPVSELDPVTKRMDYFGPMVNRSARISNVADGGQITVSSDFIGEIQRLLETHIENDRDDSFGSEDQAQDEAMHANIRRELRSLSSHGFEVHDLGERRLKGLENPEYIYLMYPHGLAGRKALQEERVAAEEAQKSAAYKAKDLNLSVDLENVWDLWTVSLRLEMLCSGLENPKSNALKPPETALMEMTKQRGDVITEKFLLNFVEHQVSRIETCITSLYLRNMVRPFKDGMLSQACAMGEIFADLTSQLAELKAFKENNDIDIAPS